MEKTVLFALVLLLAVFSASAVSLSADSLVSDNLQDGSTVGEGFTLSLGTGTASADGKALTLTGDAFLSFDAVGGETMKISVAVPEDGTLPEVKVSSASAEELLVLENTDTGVAHAEYVIPEDGTYTLASPSGNVAICTISVE